MTVYVNKIKYLLNTYINIEYLKIGVQKSDEFTELFCTFKSDNKYRKYKR